jgi:hypothetical protein
MGLDLNNLEVEVGGLQRSFVEQEVAEVIEVLDGVMVLISLSSRVFGAS